MSLSYLFGLAIRDPKKSDAASVVETADGPALFDDVADADDAEDWDQGKTPHELMGEVDGCKFLKELSVEVLQSQQRRYYEVPCFVDRALITRVLQSQCCCRLQSAHR